MALLMLSHLALNMPRLAAIADSPTLWYLTRATAVVAYFALTLSVVLGMLRTIARDAAETLPWSIDELHQFIASLTGLLVLAHLVTLKLHTFIPFTLLNFLLPLNEPYRPFAMGCGIFAVYTMFAVLLSSYLRRRLSYHFWRGIHILSFLSFILVTIHGWRAGSDTNEPWARALYVGSAAAVAFLVLLRLVGMTGNRTSASTALSSDAYPD